VPPVGWIRPHQIERGQTPRVPSSPSPVSVALRGTAMDLPVHLPRLRLPLALVAASTVVPSPLHPRGQRHVPAELEREHPDAQRVHVSHDDARDAPPPPSVATVLFGGRESGADHDICKFAAKKSNFCVPCAGAVTTCVAGVRRRSGGQASPGASIGARDLIARRSRIRARSTRERTPHGASEGAPRVKINQRDTRVGGRQP